MCYNKFMPLIYNNKQGFNSANHLVSIMNIGNQLYIVLSQLTRQSFLNCVTTALTLVAVGFSARVTLPVSVVLFTQITTLYH